MSLLHLSTNFSEETFTQGSIQVSKGLLRSQAGPPTLLPNTIL